ncbi:glucose-6-phosphate isomerase [Chloroflexota bacterium]
MDTTNIGTYDKEVKAMLSDLEQRDIVGRIWKKDHSVWKSDPAEITNRLGWLNVIDSMRQQVFTLRSFAQEVRDAGFHHVVLLGMGGSSLGPEVLRQTFGSVAGYPELIVLDSTLPACVQAVAQTIQPAHTLFLVSSKSGTTIEPNLLFQYFKELVTVAVGEEKAGNNFIAITDQGTPLGELAAQEKFRHLFINPADIGGRYSVLSYFGLVPAALIGIDIEALLDRAGRMCAKINEGKSISKNPGAWLGAIMGTLAQSGRDKPTIFTSPSVSSFGLWVEQLVAESTGKDGKGIIPVVDEPAMESAHYDDDRLFVFLRLSGDDNSVIDKATDCMKASGQPLLVLEVDDKYDLGAEFFRWEFATAVAGAILGIHPFDQPNVQAAKQATEMVLQKYMDCGKLSPAQDTGSPAELLTKAGRGDYLAIIAYIRQTPEVDSLMAEFRRRVVEKHRLATTLGYGPRYLHSTGQLHKGGPNTGLFLLVTADHAQDVTIPGNPYTFGVLADAQASGDLQALQSAGRRVARAHLSEGDVAAISGLLNELE